jgi:hypothetical protein
MSRPIGSKNKKKENIPIVEKKECSDIRGDGLYQCMRSDNFGTLVTVKNGSVVSLAYFGYPIERLKDKYENNGGYIVYVGKGV